jgi:hypothetical protein
MGDLVVIDSESQIAHVRARTPFLTPYGHVAGIVLTGARTAGRHAEEYVLVVIVSFEAESQLPVRFGAAVDPAFVKLSQMFHTDLPRDIVLPRIRGPGIPQPLDLAALRAWEQPSAALLQLQTSTTRGREGVGVGDRFSDQRVV